MTDDRAITSESARRTFFCHSTQVISIPAIDARKIFGARRRHCTPRAEIKGDDTSFMGRCPKSPIQKPGLSVVTRPRQHSSPYITGKEF